MIKSYFKKHLVAITIVVLSGIVNLVPYYIIGIPAFHILAPELFVLLFIVTFYIAYYLLYQFVLTFVNIRKTMIFLTVMTLLVTIPFFYLVFVFSSNNNVSNLKSPLDDQEVIAVERGFLNTQYTYYVKNSKLFLNRIGSFSGSTRDTFVSEVLWEQGRLIIEYNVDGELIRIDFPYE